MKRVIVEIELTDGQYDVMQRLATIEKRDHSDYVKSNFLQSLPAELDIYFNAENPEKAELEAKLKEGD